MVLAQNKPLRDHGYVNPKVLGMGQTKGIQLRYEKLLPANISTVGDLAKTSSDLFDNRRLMLKLKAPLLLRPGLKVALGFDYRNEEFEFESLNEPVFELHQELNEKSLKSLEVNVSVVKLTKGNQFFLFRASSKLSGDFGNRQASLDRYMRISVAGLIGWKPNDYTAWGVGFQYNYRPGSHLVIPGIMFNKTFNRKWGVEALLPVQAHLRHNLSEKALVYTGFELKRARYFIFMPSISDELLELSWNEIRLGCRLEHELHDWLWLEAGAGVRASLGLDLVTAPNPAPSRNVLQSKPGLTPYLQAGVFLVPPRKWRK
ncbi:MAG: hypothetical protein D6730_20355 [Bacteroidetes bacterium]|nr:MAG: hypothetical protein D6730_20355 [Bacteroidota bacterium]